MEAFNNCGGIGEIDKRLLEISQYDGEGYMPMVDFGAWRVAVLRYCEELLPQNINKFQKHDETDEVFVLLQGKCTLFIADGSDELGNISSQLMEPLKLYKVKKSTWHSHTLSVDAVVLIVENVDTQIQNSPEIYLNDEQKRKLCSFV